MKQRLVLIGNQAFSLVNFRGTLLRDLAQSGVECFALAPDYSDETRSAVVALGAVPVDIDLSRTGMNPFRDVTSLHGILKQLRKIQPDIVLSYASKPVILGTLAAKFAGRSRRFAMIEGLGWAFGAGENTARRRVARFVSVLLYKFSLKETEKVFFLNQTDINDFVSMGLVVPDQAIMLGGIGVDLQFWTRSVPKPKEPTFVFMARMIREKGVYDFIEAARIVRQEHADARFLLVGGLDSNPSAIQRSEIEAWVASGIVEWSGHVNAKEWLQKGSVFVLPSYYREGVPRSIQEAMALEMAVITTNVPGCRDAVDDGVTGILVAPRDVAGLASAMRTLIQNPDRSLAMGRRGRLKAVSDYDDIKINASIIGFLGI